MAGLTWLLRRTPLGYLPATCMTFVRGTDERAVLAGLGVDPGHAIAPSDPRFSQTPGITIVRSDHWLVALEDSVWARGRRGEVLARVSAGTEAVSFYQDLGKLNDEFTHAVDGEIITTLTMCVPPSWGGTQPDRLRPLAEELGMWHPDGSPGSDEFDLAGLEIVLLIAESALGLSLDEADLNRPLLKVPDEPADPTPRPPAGTVSAVAVSVVRTHARWLVERGVSTETIATAARMDTRWVDRLLSGGQGRWMAASRAKWILAIDAPTAPREPEEPG